MIPIVLSVVFFILAAVFFALGLYSRRYERGFDSPHCADTMGTLAEAEIHRNVPLNKLGNLHGDRVYYAYSYQVDGITHLCRGIFCENAKRLPASTRVVYQKRHPKDAYLPELQACPCTGGFHVCDYLAAAFAFLGVSILFT